MGAVVGGIVTYPSIATWYATLEKPFFTPPNWVFGPVWTLLYGLMVVSLYMVWSARTARSKRWAFVVFALQLILNVMWSVVFFGLHQPLAAVGVVLCLWLAIALTLLVFWPISRFAAYLLAPYLVWVSFASALNISVAILNPASAVDSYERCIKAPGSVILDSYPSVCITRAKQQFTNPNDHADMPWPSTLSIPELSAKVSLVGGITDAYYSYDPTTEEAYLTTTQLEEARKTLSGCTSGTHGLYVKQDGAVLKEQPRYQALCITPSSEAARQIGRIQELLRNAIEKAVVE